MKKSISAQFVALFKRKASRNLKNGERICESIVNLHRVGLENSEIAKMGFKRGVINNAIRANNEGRFTPEAWERSVRRHQ